MKMMIKQILIPLMLIQFSLAAMAQNCTETADLISYPGTLTAANPKYPPASDFLLKEKENAFKYMLAIENLFKKNFQLKRGHAKYWFDKPPFVNLTGLKHYVTYMGQIGFYQYFCNNGKLAKTDEFTVDFRVLVNPVLDNNLYEGGADYFMNEQMKIGPYIPFVNYLKFNAEEVDKIVKGRGFLEFTHGNNFKPHTDVYRQWYISKPDQPIFLKVSRREFLHSLLVFYEREKKSYIEEYTRKLNDAIQYAEKYRRNGNNDMYNNSMADKSAAEKNIGLVESNYQNKLKKVNQFLQHESAEWLEQPTNFKAGTFRCNTFSSFSFVKQASCFELDKFYDGEDGEAIYKWNADYIDKVISNAGKPFFLVVRFRYKAGEAFSQNIMNEFIEKFDFKSLYQLLN